MNRREKLLCGALALALAVSTGAPAGATTLIRASLEDLTAANETIVVADILDVNSYWNAERTFILSDVRLAVREALKGDAGGVLTITMMGGSVGDLSTIIVGGAELVEGRAYVLFLNRDDLPGAPQALTVRDHMQGAFDIVTTRDGVRAVSQANRHALHPDALGRTEAAGGAEGLPLTTMTQTIRDLAGREVQ